MEKKIWKYLDSSIFDRMSYTSENRKGSVTKRKVWNVADWITAPKRYAHPISQNIGLCYLSGQRYFADGCDYIKGIEIERLSWIILGDLE